MNKITIAIGSNLGDRYENIRRANELIQSSGEIRILRESGIYETDPVGGPPQGKFLNAVWEAETKSGARRVLNQLLKIEKKLGRKRSQKNEPRTIDLDLLFFGDEIIQDKDLTIPHPRLHERLFVLKPLSDLNPDRIHPTLKKTITELLETNVANHPST